MGSIPVSVIFVGLSLHCLLRKMSSATPRYKKKKIAIPKSSVSGIKLLLDWRAATRARPTREDEILLLFSFLLYTSRPT